MVLDRSSYYLGAVGAYYDSFYQVSDEEVIALLRPFTATKPAKKHEHR